jgi:hypothetical protein
MKCSKSKKGKEDYCLPNILLDKMVIKGKEKPVLSFMYKKEGKP